MASNNIGPVGTSVPDVKTIADIPPELIMVILFYLDVSELSQFALTTVRHFEIVNAYLHNSPGMKKLCANTPADGLKHLQRLFSQQFKLDPFCEMRILQNPLIATGNKDAIQQITRFDSEDKSFYPVQLAVFAVLQSSNSTQDAGFLKWCVEKHMSRDMDEFATPLNSLIRQTGFALFDCNRAHFHNGPLFHSISGIECIYEGYPTCAKCFAK